MKKILITLLVLVVLGGAAYYFFNSSDTEYAPDVSEEETEDVGVGGEEQEEVDDSKTVIGSSVENRDITAYHYGSGDTELLFVGGIHGGYGWNTALVAYELMDYLEDASSIVPDNVKVTVVPVMNPDGLNKTVGTAGRFTKADVPETQDETIPGRFNANEVDLNRNFDCDWQSEGVWQSNTVDAGSEAFSEPESMAVRDYIQSNNPEAVVVWYSAVGGVFASNCHTGVLEETTTLTNLYADASGYKAYEEFNFYEITGDMVNWLAGEGIPGISVLLTTHEDIEWDKNKAGVEALLSHYAE